MGDGLESNVRFTDWLKQPLTKQSHFEAAARFTVATKAAVPVINTGLTGAYQLPNLGPPQPALRLGQVIPRIPSDGGAAVGFTREKSVVFGADIGPEGTTKPATNLVFENIIVNFETLATISKASLQSISDTPALSAWIQSRLSYAVLLREEQYLLNAPVNGLVAQASPLDPAYAPTAPTTQLDAIGAAISQLEAQGYTVDCVVLNGVDAAKARLLKTTFGSFLWASPDSPIGTSQMWAVPVVLSPSLAVGTFLVCALAQSAILFERETLTLAVAFENEDDFTRNLCAFRCEERAALAVVLPAGLVKGVFDVGAGTSQQQPLQPHR